MGRGGAGRKGTGQGPPEMTPAWLSSPVSLVYLITEVSALALFHQPVPSHRPVRGRYHCCRAVIPAAARPR